MKDRDVYKRQALTSRALGTYLGSSARPIFTVFKNMEEVQQDIIKSAKALYKEYVNKWLTTEHPFKGVGTQYILFAVNEPKLFQLLFMTVSYTHLDVYKRQVYS